MSAFLPITTLKQLDRAFQPKQLRIGLDKEGEKYIYRIWQSFQDNYTEYNGGDSIFAYLSGGNKVMKRLGIIDDILRNKEGSLQELTKLLKINLRGAILEPPPAEEPIVNEREEQPIMEEQPVEEQPQEEIIVEPTMEEPDEIVSFPEKYTQTEEQQPVIQGIPTTIPPDMDTARYNREAAEDRLQATIDSIPEPIDTPLDSGEPQPAVEPAVETEIEKPEVKRNVSVVENAPQPTSLDMIPKARLVSEGKTTEQLYNDIIYIKKNKPKKTRNIEFNRKNRKTKY